MRPCVQRDMVLPAAVQAGWLLHREVQTLAGVSLRAARHGVPDTQVR